MEVEEDVKSQMYEIESYCGVGLGRLAPHSLEY